MTARTLSWEGCLNVRDLGGLPLAGGGTTRFGAVVRADNVRRLTPSGWDALRRYGVRRIVDLRFVRERDDEQDPPDGLEVVGISLLGEYEPGEAARADAAMRQSTDDAAAIELFYTGTLERRAEQVAAAVAAVASAPDGAVVVHCFVGKDRTGIVAALLLRLAGVPDEAVVADYVLSAPVVGPLVDDWIAAGEDEHERAFRRRVSSAPVEGMRRVLAWLDAEWGGAEAYLRGAGASSRDIKRLRERLTS